VKKHVSIPDVLALSIPERIQFVEDVWDSITSVPEAVELTEKEKEELEKRLEAYHKNPDKGSPWDEVKQRISS